MTCTFRFSTTTEPATCEPVLPRALQEAARSACSAYDIPKIYFARALGRRMHSLAGFGEETYLPALQEYLGYGIWVFIEGSDRLTAKQMAGLLADLKQAVVTCTDRETEFNRRKSEAEPGESGGCTEAIRKSTETSPATNSASSPGRE